MAGFHALWRKRKDFSDSAGNLVYTLVVSLLIADSSTAATVEYCRRARKIRASFDRNAFLRYEALNSLARKREDELTSLRALTGLVPSGEKPIPAVVRRRVAGVRDVSAPALNKPATGQEQLERDFAEQIAARLQPFGFTFSDRLRLLDRAERMGISRFRANVMLAMHEHQAGRGPGSATANAPDSSRKPAPSLLFILMAEAVVVVGLVWLFTA
jgi:hypothetical protein